jgi:predicted Fe-Mo cluster-binding NifX family protein
MTVKICLTSKGKNLDSELDSRFGRCQYFIIYDTETKEYRVIENTGISSAHGAGVTAAQQIEESGADVVITGKLGPNALKILTEAKIKGYSGNGTLTLSKNIQLFKKGKLEEII